MTEIELILTGIFRVLTEEILNFLLTVDTAEELLHLDFALQLHKSVEHSLGSRRATGDIHVDGDNLIDTVDNAI